MAKKKKFLNGVIYWGHDKSHPEKKVRLWYVEAPNGGVRLYRDPDEALDTSLSLAHRYKMSRRRDDKRLGRQFKKHYGMSRAEYKRKYLSGRRK